MDKVYNCGVLEYTSEPIRLRDFFNDASLQHHPLVTGKVVESGASTKKQRENAYREKMMDVMNTALTDSEFSDLQHICSPEHFTVPGAQTMQPDLEQHTRSFVKTDVPSDSEFETHKKVTQRGRLHERNLKYTGIVWLDQSTSHKPLKQADADLVPGSELVAVVRMYAPFRHQVGKRNHRIAVGCQEIMVLGSQTLAELRDSFTCAADSIICQDLSSNPFSKSKDLAKDKYKSGLIYIEETFYDDMRSDSNIEYSDQVLEWAEEKNLKLGGKARMENTKIIDLTVRLGYPYLYQHQGNCEHLFCFSDIRLLHQSDSLKLSKYPLLKSICKQHSRYCMLCGHFIAKWVTVGNLRVPHDPCYFCQSCFMSYNYKGKQKIGTFAAYPFHDTAPEFTLQAK